MVYLVVAERVPVVLEPLMDSAPLQPPEAMQLLAWAEDQVSTDVAPLAMVLGLALKLTVGAGVVTVTVAVCAALPPAPVQLSV